MVGNMIKLAIQVLILQHSVQTNRSMENSDGFSLEIPSA
ncbi:hypothetical protein X975_16649, partial [Stegodyphus mimosarum]